MSLLTAEHVTKIYDNKTIIDDISIELNKGEIVSVLGLSGSGKTTLFQCISGLVSPEKGQIILNGENITGVPGKISYMLQKDLLLPHKKVIDNVSLPLVLKGKKKADARKNAGEYFEYFGLSGTEMQYPSQLSGGMKQRAALLRTYLSADGGVALLDEPFSALDQITKEAIHDWYLDVMRKIELSTLFITHDIDEAIVLSDRIYIMTRCPGRIRDEIIVDEKRPRNKDFGLSEEFLKIKRQIRSILERG